MSFLQWTERNRHVLFIIVFFVFIYLLFFNKISEEEYQIESYEETNQRSQFQRSQNKRNIVSVENLSKLLKQTLPSMLEDGLIYDASELAKQTILKTDKSKLDPLLDNASSTIKRLFHSAEHGLDSQFSIQRSFKKLNDRVKEAWENVQISSERDSNISFKNEKQHDHSSHIENSSKSQEIKIPTLSEIHFSVSSKYPSEHVENGFILTKSLELTTTSLDCNDGEPQCTIRGSVEKAAQKCVGMDDCEAFVCSTSSAEIICYLRKGPYKFKQTSDWNTFYSPKAFEEVKEIEATRAEKEQKMIAEYQAKLFNDEKEMERGSRAAVNFNPNGECGKNGYKCVISYGLYGLNPKYVEGMIENAKILKAQLDKPENEQIFPGWLIRVYHDSSVPQESLRKLKHDWGVELIKVENIGGDIEGMFWRFLVADDDTVDRYAIRDSDSRINPREWASVKEWMKSGYSVHTIRDHPNHDRPLNGGLWGGVKGAVKGMKQLVESSHRNGYAADLAFLNDKVWPQIEYDQIGHDSYSCMKYRNSHPFPTKRPEDYQHVGQVFENGNPRMGDIDGWLRGNPNPPQCRLKQEWIYG